MCPSRVSFGQLCFCTNLQRHAKNRPVVRCEVGKLMGCVLVDVMLYKGHYVGSRGHFVDAMRGKKKKTATAKTGGAAFPPLHQFGVSKLATSLIYSLRSISLCILSWIVYYKPWLKSVGEWSIVLIHTFLSLVICWQVVRPLTTVETTQYISLKIEIAQSIHQYHKVPCLLVMTFSRGAVSSHSNMFIACPDYKSP